MKRSKQQHSEPHPLDPIQLAAKNGDIATLIDLFSSKKQHSSCSQGYSLLHHASEQGQSNCVEYLLAQGAYVDAKACGGITPLHKAASAGCTQTLNLLLKAGACIDLSDCAGHTPLHTAARFGHSQIIVALVKKGAKYLKDHYGYTPLDEAIKYKQRKTVMLIFKLFYEPYYRN